MLAGADTDMPLLVLAVVVVGVVLVVVVLVGVVLVVLGVVLEVDVVPPAGITSISNGSFPRFTVMLLVLLALAIDDVPVTGSNTRICDAVEPRLTVTLCVPALSSHSAIQSLPLDFCISNVL